MSENQTMPDWLIRAMSYKVCNREITRKLTLFIKTKIVNQEVLVTGPCLNQYVPKLVKLAKSNKRVVGVEFLKSLAVKTKERIWKNKIKKVEFYHGDFFKLPYPKDYFDVVLFKPGTIGYFDNPIELISKLLSVGKTLYFDFCINTKALLGLYTKDAESTENIRLNSFSKKHLKSIVEKLGASVSIKFYPIKSFAYYMAEVTK